MKFFLALFLILMGFSSWKWKELALSQSDSPELLAQTHWVVDTVQDQGLRKSLVSYSPPLITNDFVIAGNFIDGVKAYDKKRGSLIWDFSIPKAGVSKPLILHRGALYFGGRDGFFYSLDEKTGSLKWKYYIGSELAGQALAEKDRLFFLTQDQKLYVLDLEGHLIWVHSHPSESNYLNIRGNNSPVVKEGLIYAAFQKGVIKALKVKDAGLVWLSQPSSKEIVSPLSLSARCLLVSFFESYSWCLNPKNGKILSKSQSETYQAEDSSYRFYKDSLFVYRREKTDDLSLKKRGSQKASLNTKTDNQFFSRELLWSKKLVSSNPFPAVFFKNYLIYGFPSYGKLQILKTQNGKALEQYPFGKGLAGPISFDPTDQSLYFLSVDAYLYKISLKELLKPVIQRGG